ncbi:trypsin-like peptidase domain-containing protein [Streptomyces cirratus]
MRGNVPAELWRQAAHEDVAFIRLARTPAGARALPLGSAEGCAGHRPLVRVFHAFPTQGPSEGHFGFGVAGAICCGHGKPQRPPAADAPTDDLTTGFSGGPVLDEMTGLVVGMLSAITAPDPLARGQNIAYATPTQVLREVLPELAETEVCPTGAGAVHRGARTVVPWPREPPYGRS